MLNRINYYKIVVRFPGFVHMHKKKVREEKEGGSNLADLSREHVLAVIATSISY